MNVLVTGGRGFIGSHLVNFLKEEGNYVVNADIVEDCYLETYEDEFVQCDLKDPQICNVIVDGIDQCYTLAALMGGIGFITQVGADIMYNNVLVNANMLDACRRAEVSKFFFASSACVYPKRAQMFAKIRGLKEEDAYPANPPTFYGWEKLFTERVCASHADDYGLDVRIARFHNIFGPEGTWMGGREKAPAAICRKVAQTKDGGNIVLWGDGKQTRSFCYIDDCLEGITKLMKSSHSEPLNIGSDRLVSVNELADIIIEISGKDITKKYDTTASQGVRGRNCDLTLARKVLNWEPKISLEKGLEKTYRWIEAQVNDQLRKA